ncbi:MAG: ATP-binding protein [Vicinamibacteria bacterium]|nr:ATP-binding protein [Vicinamibacteria bacterium]
MTATGLSVAASPEGMRQVAGAFDAYSAAHTLPSNVVESVQVALDEVLSNIVRSGFTPGQKGRIEVRFEVENGLLDVLVVDNGISFDPLSRATPNLVAPLESRPIGGLGIYFVKRLMDAVSYERVGQENHLRFSKKIEEHS